MRVKLKKLREDSLDFGMLKKTEKGYIYPDWLLPYCKDKELMKKILQVRDLALQKGKEETIKEVLEVIEDNRKDILIDGQDYTPDELSDLLKELTSKIKQMEKGGKWKH